MSSTRTRPKGPGRLIAAAISAVTIAAAVAVTGFSGSASAADPLISQGKPATASSTENAGTPASAAVDGNLGTRWSSARSATRSGSRSTSARPRAITQVVLQWEAAYGQAFQIQTSADAADLDHDLLHHHRRPAGCRRSRSPARGRYVRMYGTARGTATATRCASSRSSAPSARPRTGLRDHERRAEPARRPRPRPRTPAPRRRRRSTATPAPAGPQRVRRPAVAAGRPRRDRDRSARSS